MKYLLKEFTTKQIYVVMLLVTIMGYNLVKSDYFDAKYSQVETLENLPSYSANQDYSPKPYPSVVRIEKLNGDFVCTGTIISDNYVLTAAHCVIDYSKSDQPMTTETFRVVTQLSSKMPTLMIQAIPAAANKRADYALLLGDFSNKELSHAPIVTKISDILSVPLLQTCGFSWGEDDLVCFGVHKSALTGFGIGIDSPLYPGMSGGPVINIAGQVVAVNSSRGDTFSLVLPLSALFKTLKIKVVP